MQSPDIDRTRAAWWLVALALFGSLGYVLYSFLGTFVFGVFLYYATRPLYRRLRTRVRPPSLAAALALLGLALPALLLIAYTIAVGLQEANRLLDVIEFSQLERILQPYFDLSRIAQNPQELLEEPNIGAAARQFTDRALGYLGFIGTAILHLFVVITIAFYLLRDDRRLGSWFLARFADGDGVVRAYGRAVDRDFSNIFFGNILNAALTAVIGAVVYNLLNVVTPSGITIPYPTLLGLLTGVASLVPVVGIKLVYVPAAVYLAYVAFVADPRLLWFPAAFVAISFAIVDVIPDLVLRPYVSGRGLHLGMVMLAYIFGPLLFGWYGIFLGPMLLVLVVQFAKLVLPELLEGDPIQPRPVGSNYDPADAAADVVEGEHESSEEEGTTESESEPSGGPGGSTTDA